MITDAMVPVKKVEVAPAAATLMPTSHIPTVTTQTRLIVTTSLYLRWTRRAVYRSTLMAVRVNSDMPLRQITAAKYTGVTLQKSCSSSVSFAIFDMKKSGALISPVPRSVIARLMRRTLAGVSRDGVLQNETSTKAFSSVATGEIAAAKTLAVMATPGLPSVRKLSGEIEQQQMKELRFISTHQVNDNCSQQVCCVFTLRSICIYSSRSIQKFKQFLSADV